MARKDKLRCVFCYKKDWLDYELGRIEGVTWRNIEVEKHTENKVKCTCRKCGHTYISSSMAAFRALRALAK